MPSFNHLHVHTQYSLLDGAADITTLMKKAKADGMKSLAITDHGNMFGVFKFASEAEKFGIKPIFGCEFYVVEDRHKKQFTKENHDIRYHQLLLAKNEQGYKNLVKLCSLGYTEGLYSKWPRVDKELILQYHEGLIATTCCIGAEIPQTILRKGEAAGEELFKWWLNVFGEDYYVELQRHNLSEQDTVNEVLLGFAKKYNVKTIATNDSHYVEQKDWKAHEILLCINTGDVLSTPVGDGKNQRFAFPNDQFYFKKQAEMEKLFHDVPQALDFTNEIVDKVESLTLKRNILLPHYPIPLGFEDANGYLRHITFEGARKKYGSITSEIEQRLNYELGIITQMQFAGYFLIVADFIDAGKKLGVLVGPGRGSAAGSAVAFSIGITNIDPLKYNLLFERFLNPERVSMPDIDTDFDDAGRQKVIDYVVEKYGRNQVAQIVTFGSMAAKSSIKDVARVMELPLAEANAITKLVPTRGIDVNSDKNLPKIFENVFELRDMLKGKDLKAQTLNMARELEGSIRNSGIHASAIIIAPDDITNHIPVCTSKESTLLITQFEGSIIEGAGMLKMDFLGLKTLTIIKECLDLIRRNHNIEINVDEIPLDDLKTIELFQRGDTVAVFQFEKDFARKCLREMKPTHIEDLIAMNALNRPGPMEFIPLYIRRKHQKEKIEYPHPLLEEILKPTYGIMVYQEQIMQAAQIIAGYSLGSADILRRAMGKKDKEKMAKEREKFVNGALEKNKIPATKANEIFDVMERFAEYGFNRSHSAAYAVVAFQTAYLKSHYPAEFMAAVLTNNLSNMDEITFFMDECKRMSIPILGPDINESGMNFTVNQKGEIRFGLAAVKGVGEAAVTSVLEERNASGSFKNIFDFAKRVNSRTVNKKCFESLACSGTFDGFKEYHRAQYFFTDIKDNSTGIEKIIRHGSNSSSTQNKNQHSLFGEVAFAETSVPKLPICEPWNNLEQLKKEKEFLGFYLSGHPLDQFRFELKHFNTHRIEELQDLKPLLSREVAFGGMITEAEHRVSKNGKPFGSFTIEDFSESIRMNLFSEDYFKNKHLLEPGNFVFLKCKVQLRYNATDVYELKIISMQLLSEVGARMAKNITLSIPLQIVSDDFLKTFDTMAKQHPGNCQLRFNVFDNDEKISLSMASRKARVMLDRELIDYLEAIPEVKYHLNG